MSSPAVSQALLDYLQKTFPDKLPETALAPDQIGVLIGQQKVIKHLQAQFRMQNKAGLPAAT